MKKVVSILLVVLLLSVSTATYAAGKLTVDQENFHVVSSYWTYGYAYAKVSNGDYLTAYAEYLEPGEYTYVKMYSEITSGKAADYNLTLTQKTDNSERTLRLPVETDLQMDVKSGWWTYNYMYATVTNNTDKPIYGIQVVLVLLDAEGNILDIEDESMYDNKALTPGSSMIVRKDIPSAHMDYFKANGIVPASVDAIAYVTEGVE